MDNMKTKLLAMAFLAGGSIFAQTRFSHTGGMAADEHGYRAQTASSYTEYHYATRNPQRDNNERYENARHDDGRNFEHGRGFGLEHDSFRNRGFDRDDIREGAHNYRFRAR